MLPLCVCVYYIRGECTQHLKQWLVFYGEKEGGREGEREREEKMLCYMGQADNAVMRYRREGGIGNAIEYRIN